MEETTQERGTPSRRTLTLILVPLVILVILAIVGDALTPQLFDTHPLLLIAMNSRNRILFLTVNELDPVSFYCVAFVRLLVSDPLFYLLGWYYGDQALEWAEHRSKSAGAAIKRLERIFKRAALPLVAIAPNNIICLLAGSSGIRPLYFFAANVSGTIVRLVLIRAFGDWSEHWINSVGDFIAEYRIWFLAVTVVTAVVSGGNELREIRRAGRELADEDPTDAEEPDTTH